MRLASVDAGSNTIRLLIGEVNGGMVEPLLYERAITRLAAGVHSTGRLGEAAMCSTLGALRGYSETIRSMGAVHTRCVGTSALRDALNAAEFLSLVHRETGLHIEVISGQQEAELTASGVISSMPGAHGFLIFDMGGGSTEMMAVTDRQLLERATIPVGVVKLLERTIHTDPPSRSEIDSLKAEARHAAGYLKDRFQRYIKDGTVLVGTAGTATTLASMDLGMVRYDRTKVHRHVIPLERLHAMFQRLSSMPLVERARLDGLEPERADLIIPGIILTINLMEMLGFHNLVVSDAGLLEGILIGLSKEVQV